MYKAKINAMKNLLLIILFSGLVVSPLQSLAQQKGQGWGANSDFVKVYDPSAEMNVVGEVMDVEKIKSCKGRAYGVQLQIRSGQDLIPVHLGPGWYIDNQEITFTKGDQVEITGVKVKYDDTPIMVAGKVQLIDQILILRDEDGYPAWSGWKKEKPCGYPGI